MSDLIEIELPEQDVGIRQVPRKDGSGSFPITGFKAFHKGKLIDVEMIGDHKQACEAAITSKTPLRLTELTYNERFSRYNGKLQGGASGGAGGKWGGGGGGTGGGWAARGFKGTALTTEAWVERTAAVMKDAVELVKAAAPKVPVETLVAEARALVAQYWICVESNLVSDTAPAAGGSSKAANGAQSVTDIEVLIDSAATVGELEALHDVVNTTPMSEDARKVLHMAIFEKKKHLG